MRKYPATKDFGDIADTLPSNARGDGGSGLILVRNPTAGKSEIKALSAAESGRTAVTNHAGPAPENPADQEADNASKSVA